MQLSKISQKAIRFSLKKLTKDHNDGKSKYGGHPAINSLKEWPIQENGEPMDFIGQINFGELNKKLANNKNTIELLPKEGILMFFIDDEKMLGHKDYFAFVYQTKEDTRSELKLPPQQGSFTPFPPHALVPEIIDSYPLDLSEKDLQIAGIKPVDFTDEMKDEYRNKYTFDSYHQLFGYPYPIQDDPCFDVLNGLGEIPQLKKRSDFKTNKAYEAWKKTEREKVMQERTKSYEKKKKDWTLLWQIPSEEKTFGYWGDNGNIYIMIETAKLKKNDFSNLQVTWQTS